MKNSSFTVLFLCLLPCLAYSQELSLRSLDSSHEKTLDAMVDSFLPKEAIVSVTAFDLTNGLPLYDLNQDFLCRPASVMKVLTAVTALDQDHESIPFSTVVLTDGDIVDHQLQGNLWILGGFDPEFMDEDMDALVSQICSLSIERISGHIFGDDSLKDSLYWGRGWLWDDCPDAFQPYLSTLMFNKDKVSVTAEPSEAGQPAIINVSPESSYYEILNNTTSKSGQGVAYQMTRNWIESGNQITCSGIVNRKRIGEISLYSPRDFFMHTFLERLLMAGVQVEHSYDFAPLLQGVSYSLLAKVETPFEEVLEQMLKESDNLNAEALLWRIGYLSNGGRKVSANDGLKVMESLIDRMGQNHRSYRLADGCGLSMYDYVSSRLLVSFLNYAYQDKGIFDRFFCHLPVSGIDGTLRGRMSSAGMKGRVHAKTGSYTGISALAGYLSSKSGKMISFSIFVQNCLEPQMARRLQDEICKFLITNF